MSDLQKRQLERDVAQGDPVAKLKLKAVWRRQGLCALCGEKNALPLPPPPKRPLMGRLVRWALKIKPPPPLDPHCQDCALLVRWAVTVDMAETLQGLVKQLEAPGLFQPVELPGISTLQAVERLSMLANYSLMDAYALPLLEETT